MRPIQWHLKNNCRVPESLEKVISVPKSLHPHLRWWLEESNVLLGQPLHPLKHALQIFTDASKEGWGAHLDEHTARGTWSLPESMLHINYLALKAVFLALKEFQDLCLDSTCSNRQHHNGVIHKPVRAKSSVSSSKRVSNPLLQQDSTDSYRQHNSGCLYQQRGGMKSGFLWPYCGESCPGVPDSR